MRDALPFRILIVDDSEVMRRTLRVALVNHSEWEVCGEASNGLEAIESAATLKPDLIILDLAMPVMDGLQAAREISSAAPLLPILMHTNYSSEGVEIEAKKNGVRQVLRKGGGVNELLEAIATLLPEARAEVAKHSAGGPLDVAAAPQADSQKAENGVERE